MTQDAQTEGGLLLTGGSGVLGTALLRELGDAPVTCLVNRRPLHEPGDSVRPLHADLTAPRLGLDRYEYDQLVRRTSVVVHAAAVTDFLERPERIRELNVDSTRRLLELASDAQARVVYVSTAFVARSDDGTAELLESETAHGRDAYLASKEEAEGVVGESGLPAVVVRPSVLLGDSKTGWIVRKQGIHAVLKGIAGESLPFIPLSATSRFDLVPQDTVARAIVALCHSDVVGGGPVWLTAGEEAVVTEEGEQVLVDVMARHGVEVTIPRHIDRDVVERLLIPAFLDVFPDRERRKFESLFSRATLFTTPTPFPTSWERVPGGPPAPTSQDVLDLIAKTVKRYCVPGNLAEAKA